MASDLIASLDLMNLIELLSSYIWLRDLFIWSWFVVLQLSKKINPSAVFHLTFYESLQDEACSNFFLIFIWLFHFQISNEAFSAQPTEASLNWCYKTSLILSSNTYTCKMVTYSNAHQPPALNKGCGARNVTRRFLAYWVRYFNFIPKSLFLRAKEERQRFHFLTLNILRPFNIWGAGFLCWHTI